MSSEELEALSTRYAARGLYVTRLRSGKLALFTWERSACLGIIDPPAGIAWEEFFATSNAVRPNTFEEIPLRDPNETQTARPSLRQIRSKARSPVGAELDLGAI